MNIRTLICKNYSMSRNFDSGRPKEDFDIRVIGVIEKAKNNQLTSRAFQERIRSSYTKICFQAFGVWWKSS